MERKRILLAVNNITEIEKLRKILISSGYEVQCASDGISALQSSREFRPHLILAELDLAKIDAHHFLQEIKSRAATRAIRFVIMSKHRSVSERVHSIKLGVDEYLTVPFDIREVLVRFEIILNEVGNVEPAAGKQAKGFSGKLIDMNAVELLQTLDISKKSGSLRLFHGEEEGLILMQRGEIVEASLGDLSAREALLRMITWEDGTFEFDIHEINRPSKFKDSTSNIIKMGLLYRDRWDRVRSSLPPLQTRFERSEEDKPAPDSLSAEETQVLSSINGNSRIGNIVRESNLDDLKTLAILSRLFHQGRLKELPLEQQDSSGNGGANGHSAVRSIEIADLIQKFLHPDNGTPAKPSRLKLDRRNKKERRNQLRRSSDHRQEENQVFLGRSELLIIRQKLATWTSDA